MADATGVCYTQSGNVKRYEDDQLWRPSGYKRLITYNSGSTPPDDPVPTIQYTFDFRQRLSYGPKNDDGSYQCIYVNCDSIGKDIKIYSKFPTPPPEDSSYTYGYVGVRVKYGDVVKWHVGFNLTPKTKVFYINVIFCYGPNAYYSYGYYPGKTGQSNTSGIKMKYTFYAYDSDNKLIQSDIDVYDDIYPASNNSFVSKNNTTISINIPITTKSNASYVILKSAIVDTWLGADESTSRAGSYKFIDISKGKDIGTWTTPSSDKVCNINVSKISIQTKISSKELVYQYNNVFVVGLGLNGGKNMYWKTGSGTSLSTDSVQVKYTGYLSQDENSKIFDKTKNLTTETLSDYTVEYLLSPKDISFGGGGDQHSDTGSYERLSNIILPSSEYQYFIKINSITMNGHSFYGTLGVVNANNVSSSTNVTKTSMNSFIRIYRSTQMIIIGYGGN